MNNPIEQALNQRAVFAAFISNLLICEKEMTHDQIKFCICQAVGKMLEDGYIVRDEIEMALVQFCNDHAKEHNAMVEIRNMLSGEN